MTRIKNLMYKLAKLDHIMPTILYSVVKLKIRLFWWLSQMQVELCYGQSLKVLSYYNSGKPIAYSEAASDVVSADVNSNFTLLCTSNHKGAVQFYSISDFENIFFFK